MEATTSLWLVWLLNIWTVTSETEQMDFKFYLIVVKLNLNCH